MIESETNGDDYENALAFVDLRSYIVEENITIVADDHAKVGHWLHDLIYLVQNIANGLRTVPITRFPSVLVSDFGDAVDAEGAHMLAFNVIHE